MKQTRLIIHAGFHKTGTSSVQRMLAKNRPLLETEFRIFLRSSIVAISETARAYSIERDTAELALFSYEVADFFDGLDLNNDRPVVISCEDLSGHMPGRHNLKRYRAAPKLMATFADIATQFLVENGAPPPEISFLFSTRQAGPWVKSCYAQHMRATDLTDDLATYRRRYKRFGDLEKMVDNIRQAVPQHDVITAPLENSTNRPLGPLDPLLDLMQPTPDLRAALRPLPPVNTAQHPEILQQLLVLNRSGLGRTALSDAKKSLMKPARRG